MSEKLELFDWVKIINGTNQLPDESWEDLKKQYNQYMLSVVYSNVSDLMVLVDRINTKGFTELMHFKALKHGYKSKFGKKKIMIDFTGKKKKNQDIELLMNHFSVNEKIAEHYLEVISADELEKIKNEYKEMESLNNIKKSKLTKKELSELS